MDNLICGFLKVRNELIRNGNLYRCLANMESYCDQIYAIDDASWDGTREYLIERLGEDHVICVPPEQHSFAEELKWKQELLKKIHQNGPFEYILWMDADETFDAQGTACLRDFCKAELNNTQVRGYSFHYTQLWESSSFARIDEGFDEGVFIKLWRYSPDLSFNVILGTHNPQVPQQVLQAFYDGKVKLGPYEQLHWGNYGPNLKWKCIQYWGGLGGVERHMHFREAKYRPIPIESYPPDVDLHPSEVEPKGWDDVYCSQLKGLENLTNLKETFCVIVPTYNRADTLRLPLDSLLKQTYQKWFCVVLDDGSTDGTAELMWEYQQKDPRFFYVRYLHQRGGVAMHNIGCEIAVNTAQWWARLGSDDVFYPQKLERDAATLKKHAACYGLFEVHRKGVMGERGNTPVPSDIMIPIYLQGGFFCSWANVACHSEVLKAVKEKFGNYCDPRLRNMEDCLVNYRIARLVPWVWRGVYKDEFIIDPSKEQMQEMSANVDKIEPDAYWNAAETGGASSPTSADIYSRDRALTTQLINQENLK